MFMLGVVFFANTAYKLKLIKTAWTNETALSPNLRNPLLKSQSTSQEDLFKSLYTDYSIFEIYLLHSSSRSLINLLLLESVARLFFSLAMNFLVYRTVAFTLLLVFQRLCSAHYRYQLEARYCISVAHMRVCQLPVLLQLPLGLQTHRPRQLRTQRDILPLHCSPVL